VDSGGELLKFLKKSAPTRRRLCELFD